MASLNQVMLVIGAIQKERKNARRHYAEYNEYRLLKDSRARTSHRLWYASSMKICGLLDALHIVSGGSSANTTVEPVIAAVRAPMDARRCGWCASAPCSLTQIGNGDGGLLLDKPEAVIIAPNERAKSHKA